MQPRLALTASILFCILGSLACAGSATPQASAPVAQPSVQGAIPSISPNDQNVVPPGNGVYAVIDGRAVALQGTTGGPTDIPAFMGERTGVVVPDSFISALVVLKSTSPILYQSQSELPGLIQIDRYGFSPGLHCGDGVVVILSEGSGAQRAGLQRGDLVTSVDGKDDGCNDWTPLRNFGDTSDITVLRATQTLQFNNVVMDATWRVEFIGVTIVPKGNYVQLLPKSELTPGVYSLLFIGQYELTWFLFRIE